MSCGSRGFFPPTTTDPLPQNPDHASANALDFPAPDGSQVRAVVTGTVIGTITGRPDITDDSTRLSIAKFGSGRWGNAVAIAGDDGCFWLECHMRQVIVRPGQRVLMTQQIGTVGRSGHTTGPHVHLQLLGGTRITSVVAGGVPETYSKETGRPTWQQSSPSQQGAAVALGPGEAGGGLLDVLLGPLKAGLSAAQFFAFLVNPHNWLRLIEFIGGVGLMGAGLVWIFKDTFGDVAGMVSTSGKGGGAAGLAELAAV